MQQTLRSGGGFQNHTDAARQSPRMYPHRSPYPHRNNFNPFFEMKKNETMFADHFCAVCEPLCANLPLAAVVRLRRVCRMIRHVIAEVISIHEAHSVLRLGCRECGDITCTMVSPTSYLCFTCAVDPRAFCRFIDEKLAYLFLIKCIEHSGWIPKKRKVLSLRQNGKVPLKDMLDLLTHRS